MAYRYFPFDISQSFIINTVNYIRKFIWQHMNVILRKTHKTYKELYFGITTKKIEHIETELDDLDARLDLAETFRMDIRSSLAEIKTDLLWIRQQLNEQK